MSVQLPPFDKIDYCHKILQNKREYIVLRELSILSCENAKKEFPTDWPQTKIDESMQELDSQIARFKDEIVGAEIDIKNVISLIEKYTAEKN